MPPESRHHLGFCVAKEGAPSLLFLLCFPPTEETGPCRVCVCFSVCAIHSCVSPLCFLLASSLRTSAYGDRSPIDCLPPTRQFQGLGCLLSYEFWVQMPVSRGHLLSKHDQTDVPKCPIFIPPHTPTDRQSVPYRSRLGRKGGFFRGPGNQVWDPCIALNHADI